MLSYFKKIDIGGKLVTISISRESTSPDAPFTVMLGRLSYKAPMNCSLKVSLMFDDTEMNLFNERWFDLEFEGWSNSVPLGSLSHIDNLLNKPVSFQITCQYNCSTLGLIVLYPSNVEILDMFFSKKYFGLDFNYE